MLISVHMLKKAKVSIMLTLANKPNWWVSHKKASNYNKWKWFQICTIISISSPLFRRLNFQLLLSEATNLLQMQKKLKKVGTAATATFPHTYPMIRVSHKMFFFSNLASPLNQLRNNIISLEKCEIFLKILHTYLSAVW